MLNNVSYPSSQIYHNSFYGSGSSQGIACYFSSPAINKNWVSNNSMGIFCLGASPQISNGYFLSNGAGVYQVNYSHGSVGPYNYMCDAKAIYAESC